MVLNRTQAKTFYDRFGSKQDSQSLYEDKALDELIAHADFAQAHALFELGCGTGRFALRLLTSQLPADASYVGMDLSDTMIAIAQQRLAAYAPRAQVIHSAGDMQFPLRDQSVDRVIVTYVFDLLSAADIQQAVNEARRVLVPGGKLCLVSLSQGINLASRLVCRLWSGLFRLHAPLVGGCRPLRLLPFMEPSKWSIDYRHVLTQFGVPSEVLIATPRHTT
jgi:ubiquinone/menaquinone biosynthesis C-methylase UbiE